MKRVEVSDNALSGVNIVPVIGVTLVLLVILIVMSPVMNLPNLPVELPEAITKETKDENLSVSLGSDGRISIDMEIIGGWEELPAKLKAVLKERSEKTVVIVRADKDLPYGSVEKLIRLVNVNSSGRPVALATRQRVQALGAEKQ